MTSRERVERTIRFQRPDRVPMTLPDPFPNDVLEPWTAQPSHDASKGSARDQWGSLWSSISIGAYGEVIEPAIADWQEHPHFAVAPVNALDRYRASADAVRANRGEKYVIGIIPVSLFAAVHHVRGLNNVLSDFHLHPRELTGLVDMMLNLAIDSTDIFQSLGADGIMLYDDWGLQDRLMIRPRLWREFYQPRYARLWQHARSKGMTNWLHSCGKIDDILGDMIDAGLDVAQLDQQMNMGLESLGQRFGGKLTFWCPVDIQAVMPRNRPSEIEDYVRCMISALGSPGGGFIAKYYPSPIAAGHSERMGHLMCEAFVRYGSYP